ncbi:MAG: porin [Phycisphaeraceae bacterium JB051]
MLKNRTWLIAATLIAGLVTGAMADDSIEQQLKALQAQLNAVQQTNQRLESEMAQMRTANDANWLNERRAEEVKSLVKEVLNDADTRASMLEGGMSAGHNGKNFFLASEDGSFLLKIGGQIQFRHIWAHQDNASDEDDTGFQARRLKLKFGGHVGDPKFTYAINLEANRNGGNVGVYEAYVGYDFGNGLSAKAGAIKIPFLRQELISSAKQIAVDRSLVNEYFTLNYSDQIQLNYAAEKFKLAFSFSDGSNAALTDIGVDGVDYALSLRGELLVAGSWKQFGDVTAWSKDDTGLLLGAAIFYSEGDAANGGTADYTAWTVDASAEVGSLGLLVAYMGADIDPDSGTGVSPMGILVEAGYQIIPDKLEPFVRWEFIDHDSASFEDLEVLTFGLNWYIRGHNAKVTTDVLWVYDGNFGSNPFGASTFTDGLGFSESYSAGSGAVSDDIIVWRAQFQLLF